MAEHAMENMATICSGAVGWIDRSAMIRPLCESTPARGIQMKKTLGLLGLVVMLPFGLLALAGSGVAAAGGSTTFDGNISCNLQGTVKVSPAITPTSVGPYKATVKMTNNDCIGLDGTSTTQNGETIISSTESVKFTVPSTGAAGCSTLLSGGTIAIPAITVKWKGTSKITTTVLGASSAVIGVGSPNSTLSVTGAVTSGWSSPATYQISLGIDTATLAAACTSKKGVKSFAVNDLSGDNLEIGPAF